jgi:hypothetical protein
MYSVAYAPNCSLLTFQVWANDSSLAHAPTHPTGQLPIFIVLPDRSFKGLFDSETCRTTYGSKSANAVVGL